MSWASALDSTSISAVTERASAARRSNPAQYERELLDVLQQLQWSRALVRSLAPAELDGLIGAAAVGPPPRDLLAAAPRHGALTENARASIVSALISSSSDSDPDEVDAFGRGAARRGPRAATPGGGAARRPPTRQSNVAVALRWMVKSYAADDRSVDVQCCRAVAVLAARGDVEGGAARLHAAGNAWRCSHCGYANAIAAVRVLPPETRCGLCAKRAGPLPRLLGASVAALEPPRPAGITAASLQQATCIALVESDAVGAVHAVLQRSVERGRARRGGLAERDAVVARAAAGALAALVQRDASGAAVAALAAEGGIDTVVDAMQALSQSDENASSVLKCLAVLSAPTIQSMESSTAIIGGVDRELFLDSVLSTLRRHPRDARVQGLGFLAAAHLATVHAVRQDFAERFDETGGFEWTAEVLRWACDGGGGGGGGNSDEMEQAHASGLLLLHTFLEARPDLAADLCRLGVERICRRSLKRLSRRSSIPTIAERILILLERELGPAKARRGAFAEEASLEAGGRRARSSRTRRGGRPPPLRSGGAGEEEEGCVCS